MIVLSITPRQMEEMGKASSGCTSQFPEVKSTNNVFCLSITDDAKRAKHRTKRWTEWVSKKHEFRDDSWDEPPVKQKPEDDEKFVAYENNGNTLQTT